MPLLIISTAYGLDFNLHINGTSASKMQGSLIVAQSDHAGYDGSAAMIHDFILLSTYNGITGNIEVAEDVTKAYLVFAYKYYPNPTAITSECPVANIATNSTVNITVSGSTNNLTFLVTCPSANAQYHA